MTPLEAVRRHCLMCVGYSTKDVDECENDINSEYHCLLYPFRHGRNENKKLTLNIIKQYCQWCMGDLKLSECTSPECNLYNFRYGHNPNRKGIGGKAQNKKINTVSKVFSSINTFTGVKK